MAGTYDKKYQTTFLIKCESEPDSIQTILERLFFKNQLLVGPATQLLEQLRNEPMPDKEWEKFCTEKLGGIAARGQFYSIINKLRGSGMIYKRDEYWRIRENFADQLTQTAKIYKAWLNKR